MTIDEAIRELDQMTNYRLASLGEKRWQAVKLGIEALKGIKAQRDQMLPWRISLLPGETEE
jgi:hypothetical protein